MKKIIALTLSAAMVLSLTACSNSETTEETSTASSVSAVSAASAVSAVSAASSASSASSVSAASSASSASSEAEELSAAEIFSSALFGLDENDFTKTEFAPSNDNITTIESYTRNDGLMSIVTYSYDNTEGITLEELARKAEKQYPGCTDIKEFNGTEFSVHTTLHGDGDEGIYFTNFTLEDGDKFITKSYIYPSYAFRFGDSDTFVTMPQIMAEEADTAVAANYGDNYLAGLLGADNGLADIYLIEKNANDISYEAEKLSWEAQGFKMVEEDRFNAWAKDGFTLEETIEYYNAVLGDSIGENRDYKIAGLPGHLYEYTHEQDGETLTSVLLFWVDGDKLREVELCGPTETWPCIGEAFANGIYKEFEYTVDQAISTEPDRYEQVEHNSSVTGAEDVAYYADKKEIMDVYDLRMPKGDYDSIETFMADASADYKACTSVIDYRGNDMGLLTLFREYNGKPVFIKEYITNDGDYFFLRNHIYHTYETRFGDTNLYLYMPKAIEKVTSEEKLNQYGGTAAFEPINDFMPLVVFYEFGKEDLTYEKAKALWESLGVEMIDEDAFNTIFADGITIEAVDKYYGEILGDTVIEHLFDTINGMDFSIYQTEFNVDGVMYSSAFMNWVEDGELKQIYLLSKADTWANMGLAFINSMHRK